MPAPLFIIWCGLGEGGVGVEVHSILHHLLAAVSHGWPRCCRWDMYPRPKFQLAAAKGSHQDGICERDLAARGDSDCELPIMADRGRIHRGGVDRWRHRRLSYYQWDCL